MAKRYKTKVNLHISEGMDSVHACIKNRGTTPVRLLSQLGLLNERWNLIHVTSIDSDEIQMIADSGASVIHCPVSNAKTGAGIAPIVELQNKGVTIGLGTDACSNNNTNNILNEAYVARLFHSAVHQNPSLLKDDILFDWMTVNGHKMMDFVNTGKIEVGARADLLLWDLSATAFVPLPYGNLMSAFINNAPDLKPHTVIINGMRIIENYQCKNVLEQQAIDEINAWAMKRE